MHEAVLYKKLKNDLVRCQACSWKCTIAPDQTGICGVRLNQGGKLYLTVYGRATGLQLDPIEKKPLYHFLPSSTALSFGTVGCDFGCENCLNAWASQPPRIIRGKKVTAKEKISMLTRLIDEFSKDYSPQYIVDRAMDIGAEVIAYTYNEPAIFIEYAHDTAVLAKEAGIKNVFVSNGFESKKSVEYMDGLLDAANIDLKSFNPKFYERIVHGQLKPVLKTIKRMFKKGIHLEITTLVIPDHNDSPEELKEIATFIYNLSPDIPWHVIGFRPDYKMRHIPSTPKEKLDEAWNIGKEVGLNFIYTGNVWDENHGHTFCPKCDTLLIKRNVFYVNVMDEFDQENGKCKNCGTKIAGVWI